MATRGVTDHADVTHRASPPPLRRPPYISLFVGEAPFQRNHHLRSTRPMPPRKKQKTNSGDALAVASTNVVVQTAVPRRVTRAATKAVSTTQSAAIAVPDTAKRIVRKGRLQALPDFPLEIQFLVDTTR